MGQTDCILQQSRGFEEVIDQMAVTIILQEKLSQDMTLEIAKGKIERKHDWTFKNFINLLYQLVEKT